MSASLTPAGSTMTPSSSATRRRPGVNVTPPNCTGTPTSPAPVRSPRRGAVPSAFTPMSIESISTESRIAPWITRPAQPLRTAIAAITSPNSARASDPPPSITSTWS